MPVTLREKVILKAAKMGNLFYSILPFIDFNCVLSCN